MFDTQLSKNFRPRQLILNGLIACVLCMQTAVGFAQNKLDIRLEDGFVWITSDNADLQQVLQQLASESGFKLWISGKLDPQQISVHIEKKSMTEAIRLLLGDVAHALVRDDNTVVTGLYVLPPGEAQAENELPAPGADEIRQQALQEALGTSLLPDLTRQTLLNQLGTVAVPSKQPVMLEQTQSLQAIIEKLSHIGSANPEELPQLLEHTGPASPEKLPQLLEQLEQLKLGNGQQKE
jgi:hypothetical protein